MFALFYFNSRCSRCFDFVLIQSVDDVVVVVVVIVFLLQLLFTHSI